MEEKKERKILIAFMLMMKMEWKRKKNSPLKTNLRFSYAILGERGNHSQREWIIAHELSIMILPLECVSPISNKFFSQLFYASNFMNNSMYYVCVWIFLININSISFADSNCQSSIASCISYDIILILCCHVLHSSIPTHTHTMSKREFIASEIRKIFLFASCRTLCIGHNVCKWFLS